MCGGGGIASKVRGHGESNPAALERKRLGRAPASWPGSLVSMPEAGANWEYSCFCCFLVMRVGVRATHANVL